MLHRLGARKWIARILITWGAVAAAMAFVWNAGSFYALRFGVGVMEAGFLPGVAFYLTAWFPERYRARAVGGYIIAGSFSAILGGPISTAVMTYFDGPLGLHGWQWMFIAEGVPTMLLGIAVLFVLTERPADAQWLTPAQRDWLEDTLRAERAALPPSTGPVWRDVAGDPRAWSLAALFGCALVGIYGLFLWLPQIVKSLGQLTDIEVGFLSALPPLLGVLGTILVSRSSDRSGDRKHHLAFVLRRERRRTGRQRLRTQPGARLRHALRHRKLHLRRQSAVLEPGRLVQDRRGGGCDDRPHQHRGPVWAA